MLIVDINIMVRMIMKKIFIPIIIVLIAFMSGCDREVKDLPERIAFVGIEKERQGWNIFSMEPDGSNLVRLARQLNIGQHDQWWSDNGRLVYIEGDYREPLVWLSVIDADGTNQRRVLDISGMIIRSMAISPDGSTILFVCRAAFPREHPEGPAPEGVGTVMEFYSLDIESGAIKCLTDTPDISKETAAYSPDGKKIAFIGRTDNPATDYDIYVMKADGRNLRRLTFHDSSMMLHDRNLRWSPDNRKVIFSLGTVFYSDIRHYSDIFIVDVETGEETNLTDSADDNDAEACWSPDGRKIAFSSGHHADNREYSLTWGVYTMNTDGTEMEKTGDNLSQSVWLPDNRRLLAVRFDGERKYSLVTVDTENETKQTLITCGEEPEYRFAVAYYPVRLPR